MLEIISHRGYWKSAEEKNLGIAFERSFSKGFGTETDLRDYAGEIVISHDMPSKDAIDSRVFFECYNFHKCGKTLALNIKADGLQESAKLLLKEYNVKNYFFFDMSIPDTIGYLKQGLNVFTRMSEYEPTPAFYEAISGIWLDAFSSIWYGKALLEEHFRNKKKIAVVSPDLHQRDPYPFWEDLKQWQIADKGHLILCTDLPEEATFFFHNHGY